MKVVVVGAGPGGLKAAAVAGRHGAEVLVLDENPQPGGQIWRRSQSNPAKPFAALLRELQSNNIECRYGCSMADVGEQSLLVKQSDDALEKLGYDKLILATGARELFLPFPGWTLPGVMGAGGLQAMVKSGMPIAGKRVVIAGTGPLLIAVAASLVQREAKVLALVEQASLKSQLGFGLQVLKYPHKVWEGLQYAQRIAGVPMYRNHWVAEARGEGELKSVVITGGKRSREIPCDYLACGYGLIPNLELPSLLGCKLSKGRVEVNERQQTSLPGVFAVGEATGIGGVDKALVEGEVAGLAALGREIPRSVQARNRREKKFARALASLFALREEVKNLATPDTLVCRCEDVPLKALQACGDFKSAKLYTRCGMGPCQGRVCGAAVRELFGWENNKVRPPLTPVSIGDWGWKNDE